MCDALITIIITAYNAEKYLGEAIESIALQTYSNLEIIIINDGSTDSTSSIIFSWMKRDERVIGVENKGNNGQSYSRNYGISLAKGKYVCIMDADDISLKDRISKQFIFMEENEQFGIAAGCAEIIDEKGDSLGLVKGKKARSLSIYWNELTCLSTTIIHPTVIFRSSMLKYFSLSYNQNCYYAQDKELWLRALKLTKAYIMSDVLIKYRTHAESISVSKTSLQRNAALNYIVKRFSGSPIRPEMLLENTVAGFLEKLKVMNMIYKEKRFSDMEILSVLAKELLKSVYLKLKVAKIYVICSKLR